MLHNATRSETMSGSPAVRHTREEILQDTLDILRDVTADCDMALSGPLGLDTRMVADLEFESIDIVQFILAIEERYEQRGLPFEKLVMTDGRYVDEIKVGDMVDFLYHHLNQPAAGSNGQGGKS